MLRIKPPKAEPPRCEPDYYYCEVVLFMFVVTCILTGIVSLF